MSLKFFQVPVHGAEAFETELNGFLSSHRVLSVDRHLVDCGPHSYWAICVDFQPSVPGNSSRNGKKGRIDYREVLPTEEFAVFARLRQLRQTIASRESVPVYAIFTNEQLAAMVQQRVRDVGGLASIEGIGDAKTRKYGDAFVEVLRGEIEESLDAAPGKSV